MPHLLIPDIDDEILERLRERAVHHEQTVETEAKSILAEALQTGADPWAKLNAMRAKLAQSGREFADSTPLVREDRDR